MKKLHRIPFTYQVRKWAEESLTTVLKKKIDFLRLGVRNNLAAFGTLLPVIFRSQLVSDYIKLALRARIMSPTRSIYHCPLLSPGCSRICQIRAQNCCECDTVYVELFGAEICRPKNPRIQYRIHKNSELDSVHTLCIPVVA